MKINISVSMSIVFCLLATGCSQFRMTGDSQLSFYDPFVSDAAFADNQYPQDPTASQTMVDSGRVRITDYRNPVPDEPIPAGYPEVVETDMRLVEAGIDNSKLPGMSDPDPYDMTATELQLASKQSAVSTTDATIADDPFASGSGPASHVIAAAAALPDGHEQVQHAELNARQFAEPVRPTTMIETVSIPVEDEPAVVEPPTFRRTDEYRPSEPVADNSVTIGWRAR